VTPRSLQTNLPAFFPEYGDKMILRNIRVVIPDHTTSLSRRQQSLYVIKSTQYDMYCRLDYLFVYSLFNGAARDSDIVKQYANVIKKIMIWKMFLPGT